MLQGYSFINDNNIGEIEQFCQEKEVAHLIFKSRFNKMYEVYLLDVKKKMLICFFYSELAKTFIRRKFSTDNFFNDNYKAQEMILRSFFE